MTGPDQNSESTTCGTDGQVSTGVPRSATSRKALDWREINKVVLVRLRSIGDTVLTTACLKAIKEFNPGTKVTVVSEALAAPLLEEHPLVDRLLVCGRSSSSKIKLIRELRAEPADIALDLHGGSTATIITAFSGAKVTAGYAGYRYSWLQKLGAPPPDEILGRTQIHSVEQQLALLTWCGLPWPSQIETNLSVPVAAEASVKSTLGLIGKYAVIAPAAAAESKRWPVESFAKVCDYVNQRHGLVPIVIAGPGQENIADEVVSLSSAPARAVTGLTLKELMALTASAALFVGNDSGPMHIAAAFKRPIVAIFGTSNPSVWHPWTTSKWSIPCSVDSSGPLVDKVQSEGTNIEGLTASSAETNGDEQPSCEYPKRVASLLPEVCESISNVSIEQVLASVDFVLDAPISLS